MLCPFKPDVFKSWGPKNPRHQLLLVCTNGRQPTSRSLLQVGGRWKIIRGNKDIQKIHSVIIKRSCKLEFKASVSHSVEA